MIIPYENSIPCFANDEVINEKEISTSRLRGRVVNGFVYDEKKNHFRQNIVGETKYTYHFFNSNFSFLIIGNFFSRSNLGSSFLTLGVERKFFSNTLKVKLLDNFSLGQKLLRAKLNLGTLGVASVESLGNYNVSYKKKFQLQKNNFKLGFNVSSILKYPESYYDFFNVIESDRKFFGNQKYSITSLNYIKLSLITRHSEYFSYSLQLQPKDKSARFGLGLFFSLKDYGCFFVFGLKKFHIKVPLVVLSNASTPWDYSSVIVKAGVFYSLSLLIPVVLKSISKKCFSSASLRSDSALTELFNQNTQIQLALKKNTQEILENSTFIINYALYGKESSLKSVLQGELTERERRDFISNYKVNQVLDVTNSCICLIENEDGRSSAKFSDIENVIGFINILKDPNEDPYLLISYRSKKSNREETILKSSKESFTIY